MDILVDLREMVDEYNRCFDCTPVRDSLIKQELIADIVKTLNSQSKEDAINIFLAIPSPIGVLRSYLENPWYWYLSTEINRNTGIMEVAKSPRALRLSEIDRVANFKVTNAGDWEKMLCAFVDSCLLHNMESSAVIIEQKIRLPASELVSRSRWDAKRTAADLRAAWMMGDRHPLYTEDAILSQFGDVVSAIFPSSFTKENGSLNLNIPDTMVMHFASECKPTSIGGKLRGNDELRFFSVIREHNHLTDQR